MQFNHIHNESPLSPSHQLREFLALRKQLFVDEMKWNIPHTDQLEFDQYDHEDAHYVTISRGGKCIAGARLLPTNYTRGDWSYMIRDAAEGRLQGISQAIYTDSPIDPTIYEITRFTVDPALSHADRNHVLYELSLELYLRIAELGGTYVISLMSPFFLRWFKQNGFAVQQLGPIVKGDGERYCVIGGEVRAQAVARSA